MRQLEQLQAEKRDVDAEHQKVVKSLKENTTRLEMQLKLLSSKSTAQQQISRTDGDDGPQESFGRASQQDDLQQLISTCDMLQKRNEMLMSETKQSKAQHQHLVLELRESLAMKEEKCSSLSRQLGLEQGSKLTDMAAHKVATESQRKMDQEVKRSERLHHLEVENRFQVSAHTLQLNSLGSEAHVADRPQVMYAHRYNNL